MSFWDFVLSVAASLVAMYVGTRYAAYHPKILRLLLRTWLALVSLAPRIWEWLPWGRRDRRRRRLLRIVSTYEFVFEMHYDIRVMMRFAQLMLFFIILSFITASFLESFPPDSQLIADVLGFKIAAGILAFLALVRIGTAWDFERYQEKAVSNVARLRAGLDGDVKVSRAVKRLDQLVDARRTATPMPLHGQVIPPDSSDLSAPGAAQR
jgi:hypothetical protein